MSAPGRSGTVTDASVPVPPTQPAEVTTNGGPSAAVGPEVIGDGSTTRSRARSRWRRLRWPLTVVLIIVLVGVAAALMRPRTSAEPFAPDNPSPDGARALAEVLRSQGVMVDYVRTSAEAVAGAERGTTLLVSGTWLLTEEQARQIAATEADLVLAEPEPWNLALITDALDTGFTSSTGPVEAGCADPDAQAAGSIRSNGYGLVALSPDVVICFGSAQDPSSGAYAVVDDGGRRIVAFDDQGLLSNERFDEDGTAALMLRTLGHHEHLTWYLPSTGDTGQATGPGVGDLLPSWTGPLAAQLLVLVAALAVWRGRGLGRVVTEPLPVTVRAAETTLGRGRLYRRSRSRGHAAAALRAGTARRAAARLGLPRTAGATDVIDALTRATGRSTEQVAGLLYGPPPTDDAGLLQLARQLDELESEVHRT